MTMVFTVRGIPQFYYGDEIGMLGNRDTKGDGDIRRDFPGGWQGDENNAFTKQGRTNAQEKYHNFVKTVLNFRKENSALHNGKFLQYIPMDDVYVYFRINEDNTVMVVINNSEETKKIKRNRFEEGLNGATRGIEIISQENVILTNELSVEPNGSMIINLEK